jgi:hypothetical protein
MSDELRFPGTSGSADRDSLGEPLTGLVRDAYLPASPGESSAYWAALEQRIMARVKSADPAEGAWWSVLAPWAKAGLVAAAAIFVLASVIDKRISENESLYAYEAVVQAPTPDADLSAALLTAPNKAAGTDATLNYVLSH